MPNISNNNYLADHDSLNDKLPKQNYLHSYEQFIKFLKNLTKRDDFYTKLLSLKTLIYKQYNPILNKSLLEAITLVCHPQELLNPTTSSGALQKVDVNDHIFAKIFNLILQLNGLVEQLMFDEYLKDPQKQHNTYKMFKEDPDFDMASLVKRYEPLKRYIKEIASTYQRYIGWFCKKSSHTQQLILAKKMIRLYGIEEEQYYCLKKKNLAQFTSIEQKRRRYSICGNIIFKFDLDETSPSGIETAVYQLDQKLGFHSIAPSRLLIIWDNNNPKPITAAKFIDGMSLENALRIFNKQLLIDHRNFTELFILALLINPEDWQADNILCERTDNIGNVFNLWGIDNDHAFYFPIRKHTRVKKHSIEIKNVLFWLKEMMQKTIHHEVREILCSKINPELMILEWLISIEKSNQRDANFLREIGITEQIEKLRLERCMYVGIINQVYYKLKNIKKCLLDDIEYKLTHEALFAQVQPVVQMYYEKLYEISLSEISKESLSEGESLEAKTMTLAFKLLDCPKHLSDKEYYVEDVLNVKQCLPMGLTIEEYIQQQLADRKCELKTINELVSEWLTILDFQLLGDSSQQEFLHALGEFQHLDKLYFKNCQILTYRGLVTFVNNLKPHCVTIINCEKITYQNLLEIPVGFTISCDDLQYKEYWPILAKKHKQNFYLKLKNGIDLEINLDDPNLLYKAKQNYASDEVIKFLLTLGCAEFSFKQLLNFPKNYIGDKLWVNCTLECFLMSNKSFFIDDYVKDYEKLLNFERFVFLRALEQYIDKQTADSYENQVEKVQIIYSRLFNEPNKDGWRYAMEVERSRWHKSLMSLFGNKLTDKEEANDSIVVETIDLDDDPGIFGEYKEPKLARYLFHPEVINQIFVEGKFKPRSADQVSGRHTLHEVKLNGFIFWFKIYPEQPAIEDMIWNLSHRICGGGTMPSLLMKITSRGKKYAVQASLNAPGIKLQDRIDKPSILRDAPEKLNEIDETSFLQALFRVLLTNPEDDKGCDYFLSGKCLKHIDNERAYYEPDEEVQYFFTNNRILNVKSIIYCLNQMQQPLPLENSVIKNFLKLDAKQVLLRILVDLKKLHTFYCALFNWDEIASHFRLVDPGASLLIVYIQEGLITELDRRFTKMQEQLRSNNIQTALDFVEAVQHELVYHINAVSKIHPYDLNNPALAFRRFEILTQGAYETKSAPFYHISIRTPVEAITLSNRLKSSIGLEQVWRAYKDHPNSPEQAINELNKNCSTHTQLIIDNFLEGEYSSILQFREVSKSRQILIFEKITEELKNNPDKCVSAQLRPVLTALLIELTNVPLKNIDLFPFHAVLTDELLINILKKIKYRLVTLDLTGCALLTDEVLSSLDTYCRNLQKLVLNNILSLKEIHLTETATISLKHIELNDCKALEKLDINCPNLETFDALGCTALSKNSIFLIAQSCPTKTKFRFSDLDISSSLFNNSWSKSCSKEIQNFVEGKAKFFAAVLFNAIQYYDLGIVLNSQNHTLYDLRGNVKHALNFHVEAIQDYSRAIELNSVVSTLNSSQVAEYFHHRGVSWSAQNKYREAISDFDMAIKTDRLAEAYYHRGYAKFMLNQYQHAMDDFEHAIKRYITTENCFLLLAMCKAALNLHEQAINYYDYAILLSNEKKADYFKYRGISKATLYQHKEAIDDYDCAVKLNDSDADCLNRRAILNASLRYPYRAVSDYNEAIIINERKISFFKSLAKSESASKRQDKSLEIQNQLLKLNQEMADFFNNRGISKTSIGKCQKAIEDFNKAIMFNDTKPAYFNNRGNARLELRNYQEAIKDFELAINIDNQNPTYFNNIALAKAALGLHAEAIVDYTNAINFNDKEHIYFCNRGLSKLALNNFEGAIIDFDQAIKFNELNFTSSLINNFEQARKIAEKSEYFYYRGYAKYLLGYWEDSKLDFGKAKISTSSDFSNDLFGQFIVDEINPLRENFNHLFIVKYKLPLRKNGKEFKMLKEQSIFYKLQVKHLDNLIAIHNFIALIESSLKNHKEAISFMSAAINSKKDKAELLNILGLFSFILSHAEKGISYFDLAIDCNDVNAHYYYNRAHAKTYLHCYEEAISDYNQAIFLNNHLDHIYNDLGCAKAILNWHEEAIKYFEYSIKERGECIFFLNRAVSRMFLNQNKEAILDCNYVVDNIQSEDKFSFFNTNLDEQKHMKATSLCFRGFAKSELGLFNDAINDLETALNLMPDEHIIVERKAFICLFAHRLSEASKLFDSILCAEKENHESQLYAHIGKHFINWLQNNSSCLIVEQLDQAYDMTKQKFQRTYLTCDLLARFFLMTVANNWLTSEDKHLQLKTAYVEVNKAVARLITDCPHDAKAFYYYGKLLLLIGEKDDAKKYFTRCSKLSPSYFIEDALWQQCEDIGEIPIKGIDKATLPNIEMIKQNRAPEAFLLDNIKTSPELDVVTSFKSNDHSNSSQSSPNIIFSISYNAHGLFRPPSPEPIYITSASQPKFEQGEYSQLDIR